MASVQDLLTEKGHVVRTIEPQATVLQAAARMNQWKIGSLVVIRDDQLEGIFTERDVLRRVVAVQRDPATTHVAEVMTTRVICTGPDAELDSLRTLMTQERIRHLPVVDDQGRCVGLVSLGDLNAWERHGQEKAITYMQQYIHGITS